MTAVHSKNYLNKIKKVLFNRFTPIVAAFVIIITSALYIQDIRSKTSLNNIDTSNAQIAGQVTPSTLSNNRGYEGDLLADIVIGKRAFEEIGPGEVVPDRLYQPGGVVVDTSVSPGRMYVMDSGNNRILGVNLSTCYASVKPGNVSQKCRPDIVIGQPTASDYGSCNQDSSFVSYPSRLRPNASTLCTIRESSHTILEDKSFVSMFVDSRGNLYVPDPHNHRVLKYNSPFTTDRIADEVWGQTSFDTNYCSSGRDRLCFVRTGDEWGAGVTVDVSGNLWVADGGNNRVLRFAPGQKTANLVLGQGSFTSDTKGSGLNQMRGPTAVRLDAQGHVYVADNSNNRILVFRPPFSNGMSAYKTMGRDFNRNGEGLVGLEINPIINGVLTLDNPEGNDSRVRIWNFDGSLRSTYVVDGNKGAGSVGIDSNGNLLAAIWGYGQNVYRLMRQSNGTYCCERSENRLFKYPYGYNAVTSRRLQAPAGTGVAVAGSQLVVADGRLLFWNGVPNLTNGKPADGYLGSYNFTTVPITVSYNPDPEYQQVKSDNANRIWAGKQKTIEVYEQPLTSGKQPNKIITFPINVLGGGSISGKVLGIAPTPNGDYLWISQPEEHRVARIRSPLSANPVVDIIIGQTTVTGKYCNRNQSDAANTNPWLEPNPAFLRINTLCYPGMLSLDKFGNLFVSDHRYETAGNKRLLMFASSSISGSRTMTLYAPNAAKEFPKFERYSNSSSATFEPAFDSTNRMVVGYNPYSDVRFMGYYNNPTRVNPNNISDYDYAVPNGYLKDFSNWVVAATFDKNDNLYAYDANRGQVRIYKKPFAPFAKFRSYLNENEAIFEFRTSIISSLYRIDLSTSPTMSTDVYSNFVTIAPPTQAPVDLTSNLIVNPRHLWNKYVCGKTLYWRVTTENRQQVSAIQTATVSCNSGFPGW